MATLIRYEDALCAIWNGNAIPLVDREKQKALLEQLVSKHPVNAVPVVHGEWVSIGGKGMRSCVQSCTACNRCSPFKTPFCPNCGADMRGEADGTD